MFRHVQVQIKHIIRQTCFAWMSFQTWIRAMEFSYVYVWSDATLHPSDSDLAIQFVDWCKWLVYVASLLAPKPHLLLFFVLIGFDISKILPWCFLQTYMEEPVFSRTKKHRQQQHRIPFDAVAMKATASFIREKTTQDAWKMRCSPLRPFPRVLLCPRNIPKLRSCMGLVAVWIWASLIVVLLFFGSICVACWVWASNPLANFATCQATRCYKKPELLGWDPLPPPRISITDFNIQCHLTQRVVWLIRGGGGSEAKSPAFCNGSNC